VDNLYYEIPSDLSSPTVKYLVPTYKTKPEWCLLQPYLLELRAFKAADLTLTETPPFIRVLTNSVGFPTEFSIRNTDPSMVGNFYFQVVATEPRFLFKDSSVTFRTSFKCLISQPKAIEPEDGSSFETEIFFSIRE
jgi:hypothetical protein